MAAGQTKYNAEVHKTIVEAIAQGMPLSQVGPLAGLHSDTLWEWKRKAKGNPSQFPELVALFEDVERAMAGAVQTRVRRIGQAGQAGVWQADAWWLERMFPEEFGRKDKMQIDGSRDAPLIQVNAIIVEDAEALEHSRGLLNRLASGRTALALGPGADREPAAE